MNDATHSNHDEDPLPGSAPDGSPANGATDDPTSEEETWLDEPLVAEAAAFLGRQLEERPYVTLAAAAGAGVVLGGGVPNWALRLAWRNGGSQWLAGAVAPAVLGAVERALRRPTTKP